MRNTATIEVLGYLVTKPAIKISSDGKTEFVRVNLAVNVSKDKVNFYTLLAFNNLSTVITNNLNKGDLVLVNGDFEIDEYTSKNGIQNLTYKILVKRILGIKKTEADDLPSKLNKIL
jgi:single-stranded DNA-binding protein